MKTKHVLQTLTMLFFAFTASAQQGINYKAIINDANGNALANTSVIVQFTILENGTINVYQETHNPTADANGIIIVNIGEGTLISGDFSAIDWGSNPHFLKTEIDIGDGLTDMSTIEFKTVPYALYAETVSPDNLTLSQVLNAGNDANGDSIFNVGAITIGTSVPNDNAVLDIQSTAKGMLPPRLSYDQIAAIESPADGLMLFNTTTKKLNIYAEDSWHEISMINYNPICLPQPTDANAGVDQSYDGTETTLQGNFPLEGTGTWSIIQGTGGTITDPNDPNSRFTGTPQSYTLRWTISNECGETSDDVNIVINTAFEGAVFVSLSGNDGYPGTSIRPKRTIQGGISAALYPGKSDVIIANGSYSGPIILESGINLLGGYDPATWELSDGTDSTVITGPNKTITAVNEDNVTVQNIYILCTSTPAPLLSSYAVYLINCNNIKFRNCSIQSWNGPSGSAGINEINGQKGRNGFSGEQGCENSTLFCSTCEEPDPGAGGATSYGGRGGYGGSPGHEQGYGSPGNPGGSVGSSTGGSGGLGGTVEYNGYGSCPDNNLNGENGQDGLPGILGDSGTAFGGANSLGYIVANGTDGTDGKDGAGGGGRGGDNLCDSYGSAGGGGGSGGERGRLGTAGTGGGGSFGIWIYNCGTGMEVSDCDIKTSSGGIGGRGGTGGSGGLGGTGGGTSYGGEDEQDDGGCGGYGGNGGKGGVGGHGGGGGGGPSIGIVVVSTDTIVNTNNTFNLGSSGNGGSSAGNPGADGISEEIHIL